MIHTMDVCAESFEKVKNGTKKMNIVYVTRKAQGLSVETEFSLRTLIRMNK